MTIQREIQITGVRMMIQSFLIRSIVLALFIFSLLPLSAEVGFRLPPYLPEVLLTPDGAAVPLQPLAPLAGMSVTRDLLSGTVTIALKGHTFAFTPYSSAATRNGVAETLPFAPVERNSVLYLPLQPLVDALGGTVKPTADDKQPTVAVTLPGLALPLVLPARATPDSLAALSYSIVSLYLMNSDGSGLRRLTYHSADDGLPVLSPDGKSWAYTYDDGLFLRASSNAAPVCLSATRAVEGGRVVCTRPYFSKDGAALFFMEQTILLAKGWWSHPAESHICRYDIAGGTKTVLAQGRDLCASRDGSLFVYYDDMVKAPQENTTGFMPDTAPAPAPASVHVIDVSGKDVAALTGQNPTISPDGTRIGVCEWVNRRVVAKIYLLHGELAGTLTESPESQPWTGCFSPDSKTYISYDSKLGIRLTDANLNHPRTLTQGQNVDPVAPQISPDGTQVFFSELFSTDGWSAFNREYGLFAVKTNGTGIKQLTPNLYVTEYAVSPDGKQILFAASVRER